MKRVKKLLYVEIIYILIISTFINKGVYYFEFGYRKKNGEWRKLAYQNLNLGYRVQKVFQNFGNDNWFDSKTRFTNNALTFHEKAYQLALNSIVGGSENISYEKENT